MARPGRPRSTARQVTSVTRVVVPKSQRYLDLMDGTLKVEELDDEEIFRGQLRNKNGNFGGPTPELIPRELYVVMSQELRARIRKRFEQAVPEAVDTVLEVMREGEGAEETLFNERGQQESKTKQGVKRLEAAKLIIDRVMGPVGKEYDASGTSDDERTPWERHRQPTGGLIVDIEPDPEDAHLITTAEERRKPIRRRIVQGETVD